MSNNRKPKKLSSFFKRAIQTLVNFFQNRDKKSTLEKRKEKKALLIALVILPFILLLLWQIPFVRNFFIS